MKTFSKSVPLLTIIMVLTLSSLPVTQAYSLSGGYTSINTQSLDFTTFEDTVLLVDATASWCTACDLQLQNLNKVYESVDSSVSILTLSIDINDDLSQVAELKTRYDSKWAFGLDLNLDFKGQYEVINLPTLFLFKEDGTVFKKWEGVTTPKVILDAINEHFEVPFEAAFNTDASAEAGTLLSDLFSNVLFRMVGLLLVVVVFYLKIIPSSTKEVTDTKS
ncbi:MAG: TlpA family protein disulfide reductase [Candidatus Heimdallarchaeota archaeon]|nr:TlpA family protein disulfide reductase [Candidatus Heimdallarchaeota archaeon]